MARMHTKKHGKSKSRKPMLTEGSHQENLELSKEQIEKIILDYAKQGYSPALIGEKLKKEHKVLYPRQELGKKLSEVLVENKLSGQIPYDMMDLMKKAVNLNKHIEKNKKDVHNTIRLKHIESKIWRLTKYYIRRGVLPSNWRYNYKEAELLIKGR
ncbi:MAG: 30S ribosomal protein S15 [Candidatus Micrarchaeales archaeon]|jgi:Ribosomal protein S15P/S13E|uniref:30S ribosomal protein S15 n=1 Tax=Candidatus Micrarchaeum acidiphilum ARMAN-2 TaxID=425595 RepID=C7DGI2_MICA2|nr:MAG: Ribosomal S13S15 domain protein [Candidatus Micrarchaeum acidiphilum ARMAN-2]MCW6161264.1 30S ribosomal protein S15 [Candidatus Micrarchaeales archaeon]